MDARIGLQSDGDKFSIAGIKPRINNRLWHIFVLTIGFFGDINSNNFLGVAVYYFTIKLVADTRLSVWVKVSSILILDFTCRIKVDHPVS